MSRAVVVIGALLGLSVVPQNKFKGSGTLTWKDATGETVTGVTGILDWGGNVALHFRDESGYFWKLEPSTLRTAIEQDPALLGSFLAFQSDDCSGIAYFLAGTNPPLFPAPRVTFTFFRDPTIRIRPDDLREELITRCSAITESGCLRIDPCNGPYVAIRAADTVPPKPLILPTLSYVAPLHPELL